MAKRKHVPMSSVRARTAAGAVAVVGVAFLLVSIALVVVMRNTMERNVTSAARSRAHDVVTALEAGRPPSGLAMLANPDDDTFVQLIDPTGAVVASTPSLSGQAAVASLEPGQSTILEGRLVGDDDPFAAAAAEARTPSGSLTVIVGRNLDLVVDAMDSITRALMLGMPLLLVIVAITTWMVTGRSLAPVENMRREVAGISHADLSRRLNLPPGDDEIALLAHTMNEMLERLDDARRTQQRFISDASHELRNPIAAIRQLTEVALAHPGRTTTEQLAGEVLGEDLRLQALAEDLLLLARADENVLPPGSEVLDLDDLVLEEAARLKKTTTLRIDMAGIRPGRTTGDRAQLKRVVGNLADNAARHASTTVAFSVAEKEGDVVLTVDDDGPGVPLSSRESIFERFGRADQARDREHGGAGLGLAIVTEIVRVHGGRTAVGDSPLGGARFTVSLPQARS